MKAYSDQALKLYDTWSSTGDADGAIAALKGGLANHPAPNSYAVAHRYLAEIYLDRAKMDEAFQHAELAYKSNPRSPLILATYLKAWRYRAGLFAPPATPANLPGNLKDKWQQLVDQARVYAAGSNQALQPGLPRTRSLAAQIDYQEMIFAFQTGQWDSVISWRRKFLRSTGNPIETLAGLTHMIVPVSLLRQFSGKSGLRSSPVVESIREEGLDIVDFVVKSPQPVPDYSFIMNHATRSMGTFATWHFHEYAAQLLEQSGHPQAAKLHRDIAERFKQEDRSYRF